MLELLFLLLPVAAGYGWFMGRNSVRQKDRRTKQKLSTQYSTGINYLLSNQQDKAIDHLVETIQCEDDSIEAHFAMANLFRRRGELDRALKIHEFLVRQNTISSGQKHRAIFELAKDFFSAGLLDRAEHMLLKLLKSKNSVYRSKALSYLLQIYQSTKDWSKGIALEKSIIRTKDTKLKHSLANFYCEQALLAEQKGDNIKVIELLERALFLDEQSCRANWQLAKIYESSQQYQQACQCYQQIYQQDAEFFPDVIDQMEADYLKLDEQDQFVTYIKMVYEQTGSSSSLIKYVGYLKKIQGPEKASQFILTALRQRPTIAGFKHFIKMQMEEGAPKQATPTLEVIKELVAAYISIRPRYNCRTCGFNTGTHYWSCPSCHDWEQIKPVRGLEGE
jgi:lipopolysaccharide biosynthesis regulator YciM